MAILCEEAVKLHGGDFDKVKAHIDQSIANLPTGERERFKADVEQILAQAAIQMPGSMH